MLDGARIAVVVPAYNEERLLPTTVAGIPHFVDLVIIVDDASTDGTAEVAQSLVSRDELASTRPQTISFQRHTENRGVGASIVTGYRAALGAGADVIAVMAADAQMHPDDLAPLLRPVLSGEVDYAKGNRFVHPEVRRVMPFARWFVGQGLSLLTKWAAGLADFSDSQCGYTAISARAAKRIDLDALFPRYGYPNDLVGHLAIAGCSICDVPVRPVYGDEESGIRPWHVAVMLGLITRVAARRLVRRGRDRLRLALPTQGSR